jgi:hypothetical protein
MSAAPCVTPAPRTTRRIKPRKCQTPRASPPHARRVQCAASPPRHAGTHKAVRIHLTAFSLYGALNSPCHIPFFLPRPLFFTRRTQSACCRKKPVKQLFSYDFVVQSKDNEKNPSMLRHLCPPRRSTQHFPYAECVPRGCTGGNSPGILHYTSWKLLAQIRRKKHVPHLKGPTSKAHT